MLTAPGAPGSLPALTAARAVATFGRPAVTYQYKEYAILVWPGANLLAGLKARPIRNARGSEAECKALHTSAYVSLDHLC